MTSKKKLEWNRRYYAEHKDEINARRRAKYYANLEMSRKKKREYYAQNAERERARDRARWPRRKNSAKAYRRANAERIADNARSRYATDPAYRARKIASAKKNYHTNRATRKVQRKAFRETHREELAIISRMNYAALRKRIAVDAKAYAEHRAKHRMWAAKKAVLKSGKYSPRYNMRVPDWALFGERTADARSHFLDVNMTPSQRAYARELAIERRAVK